MNGPPRTPLSRAPHARDARTVETLYDARKNNVVQGRGGGVVVVIDLGSFPVPVIARGHGHDRGLSPGVRGDAHQKRIRYPP